MWYKKQIGQNLHYQAEKHYDYGISKFDLNAPDLLDQLNKNKIVLCESLPLDDVLLTQCKKYENTEAGKLPPGTYKFEEDREGYEVLVPTNLSNTFQESDAFQDVVGDMQAFLERKELYDRLGVLYKRGYFFYGEPGNGKTNFVLSLPPRLNIEDAIWISIDKEYQNNNFWQNILKHEKNRMNVIIFEEI
jgi:hypothetical protein